MVKKDNKKDSFPVDLSIKNFSQRKKTALSKADFSRKGNVFKILK